MIAKNKLKAKFIGHGESVIALQNDNIEVHDFSIIGFKATSSGRYFIFGPGNGVNYHVYNIYLADLELYGFSVTIYSGLHSHDWTIDKTIHHNSTASYLWYMMGWHHAVINSVMYDNDDLSIAIRGSYPPNEAYSYNNHNLNVPISSRSKHFLAKNDWTHMIVNNTFGSNKINKRGRGSSKAHLGIYYDNDEGPSVSESIYFPPQNILIANNVFFDTGVHDKSPMMVWARRGINTGRPDSVNGITIVNNYTDHAQFIRSGWNPTLDPSNKLSIGVSNFGFSNDNSRNYTLSSSSILVDKGNASIWNPNSDNKKSTRDNKVDIGAFEAK